MVNEQGEGEPTIGGQEWQGRLDKDPLHIYIYIYVYIYIYIYPQHVTGIWEKKETGHPFCTSKVGT